MVRVGLDKKYLKDGKWKCSNSPTGAHHSHEVKKDGQFSYFVCKYCLNVQRLPITFAAALKMSGVSPKDI